MLVWVFFLSEKFQCKNPTWFWWLPCGEDFVATSSSPSPQQQKHHQRSSLADYLIPGQIQQKTQHFSSFLVSSSTPKSFLAAGKQPLGKKTHGGHFAHPLLLLSCRLHSRILWNSLWEAAPDDATRSVSLWPSGASSGSLWLVLQSREVLDLQEVTFGALQVGQTQLQALR